MEYPATKEFFSYTQLLDMVRLIASTPPNKLPTYLRDERIAGYFVDPVRIQCSRPDEHNVSPYLLWIQNRQEILQQADNDPEKADALIYRRVRGCGSFSPVWLITLLDKYKPKSLLDPCAGWGERMIACMIRSVEYTGVDPNSLLHYYYESIIDKFQVDRRRYTVIRAPFENANLGSKTYDMVYTSPPFFNVEVYSQEATQSTASRNVSAWTTNFLLVLLDKAWQHLNAGGIMCIYLGAMGQDTYVQTMVDYMKTYLDATALPNEEYRFMPVVYTWKKAATTAIEELPTLTIKASAGGEDVHTKSIIGGIPWEGGIKNFVIDAYLRSYDRKAHLYYFVTWGDDTARMLAVAVKASIRKLSLTVYVNQADKNTLQTLSKLCTVVTFTDEAQGKRAMTDSAKTEEGEIVPRSINTEIMEALLYNDMSIRVARIRVPERCWIRIKSGLTLKVMLRVWPSTTFLCSYPYEPKTSNYDLEDLRRLITYHNSAKKSLQQLRTEYGYPGDYILEQEPTPR
jgi:hypothetical protein